MKRIISLVLSTLLLGTFASTAFADGGFVVKPDGNAEGKNTPVIAQQEVESKYASAHGTITNINLESSQVEVKAGGERPGTIVFNIDKDTKIVDNVTKKPVKLDELKPNTVVYAWHSRAMTMSIPPQSYAYVLVVNIPADMQAGQFFEVESVTKDKDGYKLLNHTQDLYLNLEKNTKIPVFGSKKTMKVSAVKPGTKLVAWYDVVAASFPGQASPTALIAFANDYDGYVSVNGATVTVNGARLSANAVKKDGVTMIPLMDTLKKLKFKTSFNKTTNVLTAKKGKLVAVFAADKDVFTVDGSEVGTAKLTMVDGKLYGEARVVLHLGEYKLAQPVR